MCKAKVIISFHKIRSTQTWSYRVSYYRLVINTIIFTLEHIFLPNIDVLYIFTVLIIWLVCTASCNGIVTAVCQSPLRAWYACSRTGWKLPKAHGNTRVIVWYPLENWVIWYAFKWWGPVGCSRVVKNGRLVGATRRSPRFGPSTTQKEEVRLWQKEIRRTEKKADCLGFKAGERTALAQVGAGPGVLPVWVKQ